MARLKVFTMGLSTLTCLSTVSSACVAICNRCLRVSNDALAIFIRRYTQA